jgi:hypothetical protein
MYQPVRTFLAGLACAAIAVSGCGSDDGAEQAAEPPSTTPAAEHTPAGACPAGTRLVTAKDLVPDPAPGYSLAESDPEATKTIVGTLRTALGERWRDHDEQVLVRDGASNGALLVVINATEKTGGTDDLVAGMVDSGRESEPITVRGKPSRIARMIDGAYMTAANAGDCATVLVFGDTEKLVRDAAKQLD